VAFFSKKMKEREALIWQRRARNEMALFTQKAGKFKEDQTKATETQGAKQSHFLWAKVSFLGVLCG
jgi:hypothetical protein